MKNNIFWGCFIIFLSIDTSLSETLDLSKFNDKMDIVNSIDSIKSDTPEYFLLESLNSISEKLNNTDLSKKEINEALTILVSTDLIEELFPKQVNISFEDGFLIGSDLSVSDLTNASFFLNSLNKKKLQNMKSIENLISDSESKFSKLQDEILELSNQSISQIISNLESLPEVNLVSLSEQIKNSSSDIFSSVDAINSNVKINEDQLKEASEQIQNVTNNLSFAAGSAMAAASYSLDQAAQTISNSIAAGVAVDLEMASQGMGFDSFADAVNAYNQQYGTNYTPEEAAAALGQ